MICMICSECGYKKLLLNFAIHSHYKSTIYRRKICKKCDSLKSAKWKTENREKTRAWQRNYWNNRPDVRAANRLAARIRRQKYPLLALMREADKRAKNPESCRKSTIKYRDKFPDRCRAAVKKWAGANRGYFRIAAKIRRDKIRASGGGYSSKEWSDIVSKHDSCPRCLRHWDDYIKPTVDHVIPISRGGPNVKSNLQPLCSSCNSSKGSKIE